jgi:hypothetical protein
MAKHLGRWKCATSLLGPRDGAMVRSIADDDGPVRARVHDAAPRPAARPRDQQNDPEPGSLLCRVAQHGGTGDWHAVDANGNALAVKTVNGILEIRHGPNGDANAGAHGEMGTTHPVAADQRRIARTLAPGHGADAPDQRTPAGLRRLQGLLDSHYARRT